MIIISLDLLTNLLLLTYRRLGLLPNGGLEKHLLSKVIPIVARADYNWWHVWLIDISCGFLLNFNRPTHNHTVIVQQLALTEDSLLRSYFRLENSDIKQLTGYMVRILHEKS